MGAGKQTVFLLPVTSSDLVTTADLECTHLMHAKSAVFTGATAGGDLADNQDRVSNRVSCKTWQKWPLAFISCAK